MSYIDYSLIVIFFVGMSILVLVVTHPHPTTATAQNKAAPGKNLSPRENRLAYGFLALLLFLLLVLAFFAEKERAHLGSSA
jgi:hypothetical protein